MLTAQENYYGPDHAAYAELESAILPYEIDFSHLSDVDLSPLPAGGSEQPVENDVFIHLESQVQSYARAFPRVFERARGTELWDVHGRRFLDFLAGAGSLNYGHNNPVLKKALLAYVESDAVTHSLDLHTSAKEEFLTAMQEFILAPRDLDDYVMQFTGPTGTNAVEAALKIARKVTGRSNIISFTNGFHGVSMGSLAVTGNETLRGAAGVQLGGATAMPYDGYMGEDVDTIAYLEKMIDDPSSGIDAPAGVILEVVQGEGGLNTARIEWLQRLQKLCNERGIPLIVDDIQAGCGRTGTFFSFEPAGIKPDIVTLSKSLSGYGLPFSIVLIKREHDKWKPGEHNGTFRGNNMAFVTAAAMLRHYWKDGTFEKELKEKGDHLRTRLQAMVDKHKPHLVDVKGRGLMIGVRCADPDQAALVTRNAFKEGLIIERCGPQDEVVKCMMPLTSTMAELDEGLDILERVFEGLFARESWDENVHDITRGAQT
jgi:diaminobutyrate-2-oxoglutarate transaminase